MNAEPRQQDSSLLNSTGFLYSICLIAAIRQLVQTGENVNEVEAAGNTPLHAAAYEGWLEGAELLISLGAKV